jgi:hypothetical protein
MLGHRLVRDQAFKCLDVYRAKIEAYTSTMVRQRGVFFFNIYI